MASKRLVLVPSVLWFTTDIFLSLRHAKIGSQHQFVNSDILTEDNFLSEMMIVGLTPLDLHVGLVGALVWIPIGEESPKMVTPHSKLPNVHIHGHLGQLGKHEKFIGKLEKVLFNG